MQEQKIFPNFLLEESFLQKVVAGIDEAGRGPLAGPVVAACVVLNQKNYPKKINDSKKLSIKLRKEIFLELKRNSAFGVGIVDSKKIDEINILQATKLAMFLAYQDLCKKFKITPEVILVDGNFIPFTLCDKVEKILPVVKGDQKSLSIAAASIIAKETRDQIMLDFHQKFPQYDWNKNFAYPTKFHVKKILECGISEIHRKSFQPIKRLLNANYFTK